MKVFFISQLFRWSRLKTVCGTFIELTLNDKMHVLLFLLPFYYSYMVVAHGPHYSNLLLTKQYRKSVFENKSRTSITFNADKSISKVIVRRLHSLSKTYN